jgi:hypothetical protein
MTSVFNGFICLFLITASIDTLAQQIDDELRKKQSIILSRDWQTKLQTTQIKKPENFSAIKVGWREIVNILRDSSIVNIRYKDVYYFANEILLCLYKIALNDSNAEDLLQYREIRSLFIQLDYARTLLSVDLMLKKVTDSLDASIGKVNRELTIRISKVDGLINSLDDRIDTMKKDIVWENKTFMMPNLALINMKLDQIQKKQSYTLAAVKGQGSIYAGMHLFTGQAVGFTVQFLKPSSKTIGLVLGPSIFYRKVDETEQLGLGASLGSSVRFRNTYRLSLLGEASYINNETLAGGRIMAYNRFMAVGVGYSSYLGTSVSLLICLK